MFKLYLSICSVIFCLFLTELPAQLPPDFHDEIYLNGFDFPMGITFDELGRGYVWEKAGRVWIINEEGQRLPQPLIDIREEVSNWKDHGLTGFALDNDFSSNGHIYLLYALDLHYHRHIGTPAYHPDSTEAFRPTIGRVTRFTADPAQDYRSVLPDSRRVLLGESLDNGIPLLYVYHGLGSLLMGIDGTLLISVGDAASNIGTDIGGDSLETMITPALADGIITSDEDVGSYRSQYLGNYNGKVLRIDAQTGYGLDSNPFFVADSPRAPRSRIWAFGFRNPYRIVVRPETGSHYPGDGQPGVIYVGDVGNGAWEELNIVTQGGQNFGWPLTEGIDGNWSFAQAPVPLNRLAVNPYQEAGGCDRAFYNFEEVFIRPAQGQSPHWPDPCRPDQVIPATALPSIETLPTIVWNNAKWNKEGKAAVPGFKPNGQIRSIRLDEPDCPVESELFAGYSSLAGVFYPGGPYPDSLHGQYFGVDFSGWIRIFDFAEDHQLRSVRAFHDGARDIIHLTYNPADGLLYYVNLQGEIHRLVFGGNPAPIAHIKAAPTYGPGPLTVTFDGSGSTDEDGEIVRYQWDFGDGNSSEEVRPVHIFQSASSAPQGYTVSLEVTDQEGATHSANIVIGLNNTPPVANISSILPGEAYPSDETTVVRLSAEVSDAEHAIEELSYEWRVFLHHNDHFHPEPVDYSPASFLVVNPLGCDQEIYFYRIELKVTDPAGLSTADQRILEPYCGPAFVGENQLTAEAQAEQIVLRWTARLEAGVSELIVQRSTDYFHFTDIGTLLLAELADDYTFVDQAPQRGQNIYRIKVRHPGAYAYSNLTTVAFPQPPVVQIAPNPAREFFNLAVQRAAQNRLQLELYSATGARLWKTAWPAVVGEPFKQVVRTDGLATGVYFYRLINGEEEAVGRIVVE